MCIFCKIVAKEIPAEIIYEDETVLAFLDISQVTKGHTLVIPKKHFDNFLDCDPKTMFHVMEVAQQIGQHIMKKLHANGMNVLSNVNEVAGQSVFHFHTHLIPRYNEQDACIITFSNSKPQDLKLLCKQLFISNRK